MLKPCICEQPFAIDDPLLDFPFLTDLSYLFPCYHLLDSMLHAGNNIRVLRLRDSLMFTNPKYKTLVDNLIHLEEIEFRFIEADFALIDSIVKSLPSLHTFKISSYSCLVKESYVRLELIFNGEYAKKITFQETEFH